jgi:hypothetical protein
MWLSRNSHWPNKRINSDKATALLVMRKRSVSNTMNENLSQFKKVCRESFQFLIENYDFHELNGLHSMHTNQYQVRFGNGEIEILILGEGYGTIADIEYVTTDGIEIATQMLEPDWEPFKKRKQIKKAMPSQADQIIMAANRIKERDKDILQGDLKRLNKAADRWQSVKTKMGWK